MDFADFADRFNDRPCFTEKDVRLVFPGFADRQLHYWMKKGLIMRLRKPWYRSTKRPWDQFERWTIANRIYSPSYISLESALSYHGLIPEGVFHITSVTTLHTRTFDIGKTRYFYRTVRPQYFFGYDILEQNGTAVRMADFEKTVLDLLYFNTTLTTAADFEGLRLERSTLRERLRKDVIADYLKLARNGALVKRYGQLENWIHDHAG